MPDTASQLDDQLDDLPDFVDRCLGLPEGQRGPPDTEQTLKWLVAEVQRLTTRLGQASSLALGQELIALELAQVARDAVAQLAATRTELDSLAVKAGNYDVIMRLLITKRIKVVRASRGAKPDLDVLKDWPALHRFISQHSSTAKAAEALAQIQWKIENPGRTRVDSAERGRLQAAWKTRIIRDRKAIRLPPGTEAVAQLSPEELDAKIKQIVQKVAGRG